MYRALHPISAVQFTSRVLIKQTSILFSWRKTWLKWAKRQHEDKHSLHSLPSVQHIEKVKDSNIYDRIISLSVSQRSCEQMQRPLKQSLFLLLHLPNWLYILPFWIFLCAVKILNEMIFKFLSRPKILWFYYYMSRFHYHVDHQLLLWGGDNGLCKLHMCSVLQLVPF